MTSPAVNKSKKLDEETNYHFMLRCMGAIVAISCAALATALTVSLIMTPTTGLLATSALAATMTLGMGVGSIFFPILAGLVVLAGIVTAIALCCRGDSSGYSQPGVTVYSPARPGFFITPPPPVVVTTPPYPSYRSSNHHSFHHRPFGGGDGGHHHFPSRSEVVVPVSGGGSHGGNHHGFRPR